MNDDSPLFGINANASFITLTRRSRNHWASLRCKRSTQPMSRISASGYPGAEGAKAPRTRLCGRPRAKPAICRPQSTASARDAGQERLAAGGTPVDVQGELPLHQDSTPPRRPSGRRLSSASPAPSQMAASPLCQSLPCFFRTGFPLHPLLIAGNPHSTPKTRKPEAPPSGGASG